MDPKPLEWALLVPTYNRRPTLRASLELAIRQTRPPAEIVVVDGSDDWQESRAQVLDEVAPINPQVRFCYEQARIRSLTAQRNQAIELGQAPIFFMLDDDSFMYPDCAEHVMEIYDADRACQVAGVGPREHPVPPDPENARAVPPKPAPPDDEPTADGNGRRIAKLNELAEGVRSLFDVERILLPYDREYPQHEIPESVKRFDVAATRYLGGMRMTWRASWSREERFDETLKKYSAAEDMDFSYRMSRHGVILNALRARLHHSQDESARLTRHTRALLGLLNIAYLYRRNGYDPARLLSRYRGRLLQRLALDAARDVLKRRATLPYVRADARALGMLNKILEVDERELASWYGELQTEIVNANAP